MYCGGVFKVNCNFNTSSQSSHRLTPSVLRQPLRHLPTASASVAVLHCYQSKIRNQPSDEYRCRETHVSIPNTLVKPATRHGSASSLRCESRLLPVLRPAVCNPNCGPLAFELPALNAEGRLKPHLIPVQSSMLVPATPGQAL